MPFSLLIFQQIPQDAQNREVPVISYRKLDKHGRLYMDAACANREYLLILLEPKPEAKIDFLKAGK